MDDGPQLPCDGGSALTLDGSVRRTRRIPGRLNLRTEFRDSRAAGPALLLLMLTRFSGQFPLLPCLMIVRLCHDVLLRLRIGLPEDRCIRVAGFRRRRIERPNRFRAPREYAPQRINGKRLRSVFYPPFGAGW